MSEEKGISLLVRNLRYETSPEDVRQHFGRYGEIRDVYLPLDYFTKRPRGFGFVEFLDERDAHSALRELDKSMLDGNAISVTIAQQGRKSPETMKGRDKPSFNRRSDRRGDSVGRRRSRGRSRSPYRSRRSESPGRWSPSPYSRRYSRDRRDSYRRENYRDSDRDAYRDSYRDSHRDSRRERDSRRDRDSHRDSHRDTHRRHTSRDRRDEPSGYDPRRDASATAADDFEETKPEGTGEVSIPASRSPSRGNMHDE